MRRFYQLAVTHLSPAEVAKFILAIHSTVVQCVQGDGSEQGGGGKVVEEKEGEESAAATFAGEGVCLRGVWKYHCTRVCTYRDCGDGVFACLIKLIERLFISPFTVLSMKRLA